MKARIYDLGNSFIIEATAYYKLDEETIYLRTSEDIAQKGPDFYVHYTDDSQGVYDLRCTYVGYEKDGAQFINILQVEETIKSIQRRRDVKVKTNLLVRVALLDQSGSIQIDPETMKARQFRGYLRDISAGGVMIETSDELEVNQKIMFPFDKGSTPIIIYAQVLREQPPGENYRRYGCMFINNSSGKESVIREYVYRMESARKNMARSPQDV